MKRLQTKGDGIYVPPKEKNEKHFPQPNCSLMPELCKDDYVEDNKKLPQFNQGSNQGFTCGSIKEIIEGLM